MSYRTSSDANRSFQTRLLVAALLAIAVVAIVSWWPSLAHADLLPPKDEPGDGDEFAAYQARGWTWAYLGAFGFGFLTSLTPCVYPMIPIVLGIFGARGEAVSRGKALTLATLYILGMGVTYAALGVVFALLGKKFGTILAEPAVVIPIVLLYLALAASMFGAFELNLPASVQAKLNRVGGSGYGGAFAMGLVGGFTAAPCTGPFLAGILGFVASTRNVAAGSTLLFTYALGMGVLFWVLAAAAISLPKSGRWMEWVKSIGGIALLAAGLHFLKPIVPWVGEQTSPHLLFLGASLVVVAIGVVLGAVHLSFHDRAWIKVRKGTAVLFAVIGVSGVVNWALTPERELAWVHDEEVAFSRARDEGKGVMIDFAAEWCTPCKELEVTFGESPVYETVSAHFVPLKFDVTEETAATVALQEKYDAETLPAVIFLTADGTELGRVRKAVEADAFMNVLGPAAEKVAAGAAAGSVGADARAAR